MQIASAKNVAPSIRAAAINIEVRTWPATSGCRPLASMAAAASFPIPMPAPITVTPAPIPAARYANAVGFICYSFDGMVGGWCCSLMIVLFAFMRGLHTEAHEERGEHGKDICLQERGEEFQHADAEDEGDRDRGDDVRFENEDQPDQRDDDDVAADHVGKQTDHQGKRLREQPQDFDRYHDRPERPVDAAREVLHVVPEPLRPYGCELYHQERDQ